LRVVLNAETENPRAKLAEFETLLNGGNAERGRIIFFGNKVAELQLRKDQIRELRRSAISIMPEGLERGLTREEFRDLLAFLQSLK
jgi:hypothetical protein